MGDERRWAPWLLVGAIFLLAAPARAQGNPADWVGTWAAVRHRIDVLLRLTFRVEDGRITGSLDANWAYDPGETIRSSTLVGRRLSIEIEPDCDDCPESHFVLELAADGSTIRVVEGRMHGRPIPHYRLRRRYALWRVVQFELYDLGHENDARTLQYYAALGEAVGEGLAEGLGHPLTDRDEALCALDVVTDAFDLGVTTGHARAVALALARSVDGGTLCHRNLDELTVEGLGSPEHGCALVRVEDEDGSTTLRPRPISRAESDPVVPNGALFAIRRTRGRWLRVRGWSANVRGREGWLWAGNVRCLR